MKGRVQTVRHMCMIAFVKNMNDRRSLDCIFCFKGQLQDKQCFQNDCGNLCTQCCDVCCLYSSFHVDLICCSKWVFIYMFSRCHFGFKFRKHIFMTSPTRPGDYLMSSPSGCSVCDECPTLRGGQRESDMDMHIGTSRGGACQLQP